MVNGSLEMNSKPIQLDWVHSVSRFTLRVSILFLVRFGLLGGFLFGNSCFSVEHMFSVDFDYL